MRIHGRGGQGSFVAAQILAIAGLKEGYYVQASLHIRGGGDRRGAPVFAYVRMNKKKIREKTTVLNPDYIIVQDITLFETVDVLAGLKPNGMVLINTERKPEELELGIKKTSIKTVPASKIALEVTGSPITSTTILGAFAAIMKEKGKSVSVENIKKAIIERFPGKLGVINAEAAQKAYEYMEARI